MEYWVLTLQHPEHNGTLIATYHHLSLSPYILYRAWPAWSVHIKPAERSLHSSEIIGCKSHEECNRSSLCPGSNLFCFSLLSAGTTQRRFIAKFSWIIFLPQQRREQTGAPLHSYLPSLPKTYNHYEVSIFLRFLWFWKNWYILFKSLGFEQWFRYLTHTEIRILLINVY